VSADYFEVAGTRILRGRGFGPADTPSSEPVVVIDETLAAAVWPGEVPIGKCAYFRPTIGCVLVVGIAESRRGKVIDVAIPEIYVPLAQAERYSRPSIPVPPTLLVRLQGDLREPPPGLIVALADAAKPLHVIIDGMADRAARQARSRIFGTKLFAWCGIAAMLMAGVGLLAAFSVRVQQRTREIGVRLAIGASRTQALRPVFKSALRVVLLGSAGGLLLVTQVGGLMQSLFFEVTALDPKSLFLAALGLLVAAGAGLAIPAVRAARVDPLRVLRQT